jgi:hypothetical protein
VKPHIRGVIRVALLLLIPYMTQLFLCATERVIRAYRSRDVYSAVQYQTQNSIKLQPIYPRWNTGLLYSYFARG